MPDPIPNPNPTSPSPTAPQSPDPSAVKPAAEGTIAAAAEPQAQPTSTPEPRPDGQPVAEPPATALAATDFTLPEGMKAEDPGVAEFLEAMNGSKVGKEGAQKLMDRHAAAVKAAGEAPLRTFNDMNTKWIEQIKADPDIGGEKLNSVVKPTLAKAIDTLPNADGFRRALDLTGAGNNPDVVRGLYHWAKAVTESTSHVNGNPAAKPAIPSAAQAMYPNLNKGP